ncbi:MAG: hypothetical protein ACI82F_004349, partial [Planctomycetota bacterium]
MLSPTRAQPLSHPPIYVLSPAPVNKNPHNSNPYQPPRP